MDDRKKAINHHFLWTMWIIWTISISISVNVNGPSFLIWIYWHSIDIFHIRNYGFWWWLKFGLLGMCVVNMFASYWVDGYGTSWNVENLWMNLLLSKMNIYQLKNSIGRPKRCNLKHSAKWKLIRLTNSSCVWIMFHIFD